ncbi:MAG TPA: HepT-like ribonuclease domain-containing protein [Acidimicrobiales bacterium]|nr:HepT-like ribonuclease domain-containing protein [Acidimicrobiales bacterium]
MSRSDDERVADILEAAAEVGALVASGREEWDRDRTRRLAVERLLEIIGEAARALSDEGRARYGEVPWPDVVGLRTVLAHHYHRVDPNQVWTIATIEVPRLVRHLAPDA